MAKIKREEVLSAALELLSESGLDALSTRRLAQKLGVESASLYWHFRDKAVLLGEMAAAVISEHHTIAVPVDIAQWDDWFADNMRSFRQALLAYRDGARLHAGSVPGADARAQIIPKMAYLKQVGFSEQEAGMALFAAGQFTIGCVLEQQAQQEDGHKTPDTKTGQALNILTLEVPDPEAAFEFGLLLIIDGLRLRLEAKRSKRSK